jgi:hypothetical protein
MLPPRAHVSPFAPFNRIPPQIASTSLKPSNRSASAVLVANNPCNVVSKNPLLAPILSNTRHKFESSVDGLGSHFELQVLWVFVHSLYIEARKPKACTSMHVGTYDITSQRCWNEVMMVKFRQKGCLCASRTDWLLTMESSIAFYFVL